MKIQHKCGMVIISHIYVPLVTIYKYTYYLASNVDSYKIVTIFALIRNRTESYKKLCFI